MVRIVIYGKYLSWLLIPHS